MAERIFGLVAMIVALAYSASAVQIETSFLTDPVGPRVFPIAIGILGALCALYLVVFPDSDPSWPGVKTCGVLILAATILVGYAYALRPFGFIVPTAVAAGLLSYQIAARPIAAILSGAGLAVGLFLLFKYMLGLGLVPWPQGGIG